MHRPVLAAFAVAGLAVAAPLPAHAGDGIFGNFLSGFGRASEVKPAARTEIQERELEARNLRREYWERERNRLAQNGLARDAPTQTIATR
jgi:hypothetical protein